jgi:hypothetical protein
LREKKEAVFSGAWVRRMERRLPEDGGVRDAGGGAGEPAEDSAAGGLKESFDWRKAWARVLGGIFGGKAMRWMKLSKMMSVEVYRPKRGRRDAKCEREFARVHVMWTVTS